MIECRIDYNAQDQAFDWYVQDNRPPRIRSSGTSPTLEDAIGCVQSNLALLVVDK